MPVDVKGPRKLGSELASESVHAGGYVRGASVSSWRDCIGGGRVAGSGSSPVHAGVEDDPAAQRDHADNCSDQKGNQRRLNFNVESAMCRMCRHRKR